MKLIIFLLLLTIYIPDLKPFLAGAVLYQIFRAIIWLFRGGKRARPWNARNIKKKLEKYFSTQYFGYEEDILAFLKKQNVAFANHKNMIFLLNELEEEGKIISFGDNFWQAGEPTFRKLENFFETYPIGDADDIFRFLVHENAISPQTEFREHYYTMIDIITTACVEEGKINKINDGVWQSTNTEIQNQIEREVIML